MHVRTNLEMAIIVEQGLARDLMHGSVAAWTYLATHKVPNDVILRVLREPGQRRMTDALAATDGARLLALCHSSPTVDVPLP